MQLLKGEECALPRLLTFSKCQLFITNIFMIKHFTRTEDFTTEEYQQLFEHAAIFEDGIAAGKNFVDLCPGRVIATMFFQESTRTAASLQAAMIRLGGGWHGMSGTAGTYLASGEEDLDDTLLGVAPLADIMAVRDKSFDLTACAAKGFPIPLINAMCGGEEHTIGGLLFPYSLLRHFGKLEGLKIGLYGMSKSSRPLKAYVKVLSRFGVSFVEDSVIPEMRLPDHIREIIAKNGSSYHEGKLDDFIGDVDVLNVIEGLPQAGENPQFVEEFNKRFIPITNAHFGRLQKDVFVEVAEPRQLTDGRLVALKETDHDPRNKTKKILQQFIPVNMAIITYLLGIDVKRRSNERKD